MALAKKALLMMVAHAFPLLLALSSASAAAQGQESITYDETMRAYLVRWFDSELNQYLEGYFYPATQIAPLLLPTVSIVEGTTLRYQYEIQNGSSARQALEKLTLLGIKGRLCGSAEHCALLRDQPYKTVSDSATPIPATISDLGFDAPTGWSAAAGLNLDDAKQSYWAKFFFTAGATGIDALMNDTDGILPGQKQAGFSLLASALPWIANARLYGDAPHDNLPVAGPDTETPVTQEFSALELNDFVTHITLVPAIAIGASSTNASILSEMRTRFSETRSESLMDPVSASMIEVGLRTAALLAKNGDGLPLKKQLIDLRNLVTSLYRQSGLEGLRSPTTGYVGALAANEPFPVRDEMTERYERKALLDALSFNLAYLIDRID